jgi:hypothetical protein
MRSGSPLQSCGCFGEITTPPSVIHVVTNGLLAAASAAAAIGGLRSTADALADQPGAGVPFVLLVGITTYLVYVLLTDLARALHAAEPA